MASLQGKTIALLEARRAQEMAGLITRHGGVPYLAPALREVPLENRDEVVAFIDRLCQGSVDVIIFLTGVGCRALLQTAEALERLPKVLSVLSQIKVVARGPKPVAVLKGYNVHIDFVPPEPNTSEELVAELRQWDLRDKTVAVQLYGGVTPYLKTLRQGLKAMGTNAVEVSLYSWQHPIDEAPLLRFLDDCQAGRITVVTVTSSSQGHHLFEVAESRGRGEALQQALNSAVLVASVGPVTAQALREHGVKVDIMPEHHKMGHLILAIAEYLEKAN